jgi:E3 ubiquitin-protein ligase DOA10
LGPMCRICHERTKLGDAARKLGKLVKACKCSGSIAFCHEVTISCHEEKTMKSYIVRYQAYISLMEYRHEAEEDFIFSWRCWCQ